MADPLPITVAHRQQMATLRVARLAARQFGVVSRAQLFRAGLSEGQVARWLRGARMHRIHPGVYALGHARLSLEGELAAALIYAGPGAALSHETGGWWWDLLERRPRVVHVSTSGRARSRPGLRIHHPSRVERVMHRALPVTPARRTLVDMAACSSEGVLRRALAEAEYRRLIRLEDIAGLPRAPALRRAVAGHLPALATSRSELERRFLFLCEAAGLPMPKSNVIVCGFEVDAVWPNRRLVVELDGHTAHARPLAAERDRRRELTLRAAGYGVRRYTWLQVTADAGAVAADLRSAIDQPARLPLRPVSLEGCRSG
jgi:hypothetical protein